MLNASPENQNKVKYLERFDDTVLVPYCADVSVSVSQKAKVIESTSRFVLHAQSTYGVRLLRDLQSSMAWYIARSLNRGSGFEDDDSGNQEQSHILDGGWEDDSFQPLLPFLSSAGITLALPIPRPRFTVEVTFQILQAIVAHLPSDLTKELQSAFLKCFAFSLAFLFGSGNSHLRTLLRSEVVPLFLARNSAVIFGDVAAMKNWALKMWERIEAVYEEGLIDRADGDEGNGEGNTDEPTAKILNGSMKFMKMIRLDIPALLSRSFDFFMGTELVGTKLKFKGAEAIALDLREKELFWKIIYEGLLSEDASYLKYSVFLLKRAVDFSVKFNMKAGSKTWTPYFKWQDNASKELATLWEDYYTYFDVFTESTPHLVEPGPKPDIILHNKWWLALVNRGISNRIGAIRKTVFEYLLKTEDPNAIACLCSNPDYLFNSFLPKLDELSLYCVSGLGAYQSPFGELVVEFIPRLILGFKSFEERKSFLTKIFASFPNWNSRIAALYCLMGIESYSTSALEKFGKDSKEVAILGPKEFEALRDLLAGNRSVTVWTSLDSKKLVRLLSLRVYCRLTDKARLDWDHVRSTLCEICDYEDFKRGSPQFEMAQQWCFEGFGTGDDVATLESSTSKLVEKAQSIAAMINFVPAALLENALSPLSLRLARLRTGSIYASKGLVDRCFILVDQMFSSSRRQQEIGAPLRYISEWPGLLDRVDEIYEAAYERLLGSITDHLSFDLIAAYSGVLEAILEMPSPSQASIKGRVESIWEKSWKILSTEGGDEELQLSHQTKKFSALKCMEIALKFSQKHCLWSLQPCDSNTAKFLFDTSLKRSVKTNEERNTNWSEILHQFQNAQYDCIQSLIRYSSSNPNDKTNVSIAKASFSNCLEALSNASYVTAAHILKLATTLLDQDWEIDTNEVSILAKHGRFLIEENWTNAKYFLEIVRGFAETFFHEKVLRTEFGEGNTEVEQILQLYADLGALKTSISPSMSKHVFKFWSKSVSASESDEVRKSALDSMKRYSDIFIRLLLFGPPWDLNKDQRRLDAAISLKIRETAGEGSMDLDELKGTAEMNFGCKDYTIRIRANDILARLNLSKPEESQFALSTLSKLVNLFLSGAYASMFSGSIESRMQLRLWCSVHLVLDSIPEPELDEYVDKILDSLEIDSVVSIRYYIEWAALRLLIRKPDLLPRLLTRLNRFDRRANICCSYLLIVAHIGRFIPLEAQKAFYKEAFGYLMPWIATNHFSLRLYAQYAVHQLWKACTAEASHPDLKSIAQNSSIAGAAAFLETNPDCVKHRQKAQKDYFLSEAFDPISDLSMAFIFHGAMIVSNVTEEERISSQAFESELEVPRDEQKEEESYLAPLQRKITPWEAMLMTDIDISQTREEHTKKERNTLIVVASLISKAPNLGGLCRTCEIFNAELLVVGNMKLKDDPAFMSTAVTSDKWMPMIEVKEPDLLDYLLKMKREGYSILGIEQATTSIGLEAFEFPKQSVLVLGKEKEGIPATILAVLDHILEIPQFGFIRSLNVHVSGALIIWEYTRQLIAKK
ncbi:Tar (HIV-1) RNA binding protein 1 [Phlyctochytrium planicorne]|nr:Tar (HIV-1) RNA binding protein 1 [Phlyctochytrium planicorne]